MALPILDTFGRRHTYLRISLTDKCNLRCTYCMPQEDMQFMPTKWLMQSDEISYLAGLFVEMGVEKIRLTGGEPLVRKDAGDIIAELGKLPASLTLTTNAVFINQFIPQLKAAGVTSLNVSLDTLKEERFRSITKRDHFGKTLDHIRLLLNEGFVVKVNMVVMRGTNDDEVNDFVRMTWRNLTFMFVLSNSCLSKAINGTCPKSFPTPIYWRGLVRHLNFNLSLASCTIPPGDFR
jgi:cyclic pyranopterin phosphate synthase